MVRRIVRTGRVVEARGQKVVRFAAPADGCPSASGVCACGRRAAPDLTLAPLGLTATAGDRLAVAVTDRGLASVALLLFGVPLAMLLLGALAGTALADRVGWPAEISAGVGGLTALVLAWWLALRSGKGLLQVLGLDVRAETG